MVFPNQDMVKIRKTFEICAFILILQLWVMTQQSIDRRIKELETTIRNIDKKLKR